MRIRTPYLLATLALFIAPLAAADRPNILLIMVDDLNDWIGPNGKTGNAQVITPHIDKLASRSLVFTNAHCNAPICGASRFSLFTGLRPSTTDFYIHTPFEGRLQEYQDRGYQMFPAHLRNQGYKTLAAGKLYHLGTQSKLASDDWDIACVPYSVSQYWIDQSHGYGNGFPAFLPFPKGGSQIHSYGKGHSLSGGPLDPEDIPNGQMPDEYFADWAVNQLEQTHEKPFFMAVGFVRPHVPFTAPRKYFDMYDAESIQIPQVPADDLKDTPLIARANAMGLLERGDHQVVTEMGEEYWRMLVHSYLACTTFVDAEIGRVLNALEKSEYADDTLVILTTDHGQHLGEKLRWRKMSLWEESTRVPLMVSFPDRRSAGRRANEAVSLLDLAPTILDLADAEPLPQHQGKSLKPFFEDPQHIRNEPAITTWLHGNHSVRDERWRYTRYRDGSEELYDHQNDPLEHRNLARHPGYKKTLANLKKWIPNDRPLPEGMKTPDDPLQIMMDAWNADPESIPLYLR